MLSRALIVLLIVLNAGVALWWATRPAPVLQGEDGRNGATASVRQAEQARDSSIARLQLLREVPRSAIAKAPPATEPGTMPATAPRPPAAAVTSEIPVEQRCYAIGPFTSAEALSAARVQLQPQAASLRAREMTPAAARGWRVLIPPLADRAAAQAVAERIKAAGFDDYLVVPAGDEANSIALGRYGSEGSARQRETALRAAGFQAQAQPLGGSGARSWLDIVVADAAFDPARARQAVGAAQASEVDCATLR